METIWFDLAFTVFISGFLGCCGAWKESTWMLGTVTINLIFKGGCYNNPCLVYKFFLYLATKIGPIWGHKICSKKVQKVTTKEGRKPSCFLLHKNTQIRSNVEKSENPVEFVANFFMLQLICICWVFKLRLNCLFDPFIVT